MKTLSGLLLAATLFACGGTSDGGSSVNGTVSGASFGSVVDARALIFTNSSCGGVNPPANGIFIALSSTAGICSALSASREPANSATLLLELATFWINPGSGAAPSSSPALGLKTYNINDNTRDANGFGVITLATFNSVDASCNSKLTAGSSIDARSGTITLTSVSSSGVSGSFSLVFGTDTMTGTFSTGVCGLTESQACAAINSGSSTCG